MRNVERNGFNKFEKFMVVIYLKTDLVRTQILQK